MPRKTSPRRVKGKVSPRKRKTSPRRVKGKVSPRKRKTSPRRVKGKVSPRKRKTSPRRKVRKGNRKRLNPSPFSRYYNQVRNYFDPANARQTGFSGYPTPYVDRQGGTSEVRYLSDEDINFDYEGVVNAGGKTPVTKRELDERLKRDRGFLSKLRYSRGVVDLEGANLEGWQPGEQDWFSYPVKLNLRKANLKGANLKGANLREANLEDADLQDANLEKAILAEAYLKGADLRKADLKGAYLKGADLRISSLREANLEGANLENADLRKAYLPNAKLEGAKLEGAKLEGAFHNSREIDDEIERQERERREVNPCRNSGRYKCSECNGKEDPILLDEIKKGICADKQCYDFDSLLESIERTGPRLPHNRQDMSTLSLRQIQEGNDECGP